MLCGTEPLVDCVERGRNFARTSMVGYTEPTKSWIEMPGNALAEIESIKNEAAVLDSDVKRCTSNTADFAAFKTAWAAFLKEWQDFYDSNGPGISGWFGRTWGSTTDRARDYGNKLNDWRNKLAGFGAKTTEPPATPKQNREDSTAIPWKPVVIGTVVVAGLFGGGYLLSKTAAVGSLFRKPQKAY